MSNPGTLHSITLDIGSWFGGVLATDADYSMPFSLVIYSLPEDAGGRFLIDSQTGLISVRLVAAI